MKLTDELWTQNIEIATSCLATPFVKRIQNGDLPLQNFQNYIAQDAEFLEAFARAYGLAIAKSNDRKSLTILSNLLVGVINEVKLHDSYATRWEVNLEKIIIHPATKNYTDFLYEVSNSNSMCAIISAMIPCMRLYAWLGMKLKEIKLCESNKYNEWIQTYSSVEFRELVSTIEALLNIYFKKEEVKEIHYLYSRAMHLELSFFEAYSPL